MMKILLILTTFFVFVLSSTADAGGRRHRHGYNILPYAAGALALGIMGGYAYDRYRTNCWREYYPIYDPYTGRYLYNESRVVCN